VQIKITPRPASKELADQRTIDKELASRDEQLEQKHFATPEEIEKEKLPTEEILSLPMFKVDFYLLFAQTLCGHLVSLNVVRFW
jgi:U11/U12 small nuclear ribonucleoprotein SNRNP65